MTHEEIKFYLGVLVSVTILLTAIWRVTVGSAIKRLEKDMVTKAELLAELMKLREFLRKNFVQKRNGRGE